MFQKLFVAVTILCSTTSLMGQTLQKRPIPVVDVKDINGKTVSTSQFSNNGKPMVLDFWATWCKPCVNELSAIHDLYDDWQKETGVKILAISVDDARTMSNVKPFINGKGWEYEVYVDPNGDLKRALNVGAVPYVFLVNGSGEIVSVHTGYAPGDEKKLFEEIKALASESIKP